ncbi:MAG: Uma2 family endonuclease [Gemmatales bacterium]|nr:Uma2 family endonuclease [Gemmatales bacterium]
MSTMVMATAVAERGEERSASAAVTLSEEALAERGEVAGQDDERLYEIEYGRRVEKPMSALSSALASELGHRLAYFLFGQRVGRVVAEAVFILNAERNLRRRPDVAFVSTQRWPLDKPIPAQGDWPVVPDLAVEVLSPGDTAEKLAQKVNEYFRSGVRLVWVVLPMIRQVYVYTGPTAVRILTKQDELDGGDVLPGFRLQLAELFAAVPVERPAE